MRRVLHRQPDGTVIRLFQRADLKPVGTAVIEYAAVRILCILLFEPVCNLYEIPAGVLRGSGHALYLR